MKKMLVDIIIMYYTFPGIWCVTDVIVSFWANFFPFTPLTAWKMKISKQQQQQQQNSADPILQKCPKIHDHML